MVKFLCSLFASISFLLLAAWFGMWMLSSASLASGSCENNFSFFHEDFRCRQPFLAAIGFVISLCVSIFLCFLSIKVKRKSKLL